MKMTRLLLFGDFSTCKSACWSLIGSLVFSASGYTHPSSLYQDRLPIISNEECSKAYNGTYYITESMVCAGYMKNRGIGACQVRSVL